MSVAHYCVIAPRTKFSMKILLVVICVVISSVVCQKETLKCKSEVSSEICFIEKQNVTDAQEVSIELLGAYKPKLNDIKRVYIIDTKLPNDVPPAIYITFPNLWLLALQDASLTEWKRGYLKGATQLKVLYIVNNPIENFNDDSFYEVPRLEELWIENCKITTINSNMLKSFNALKELNLSYHDYAQPLEAELLAPVKQSLVYLDFSGSNIDTLPTGMLRDFENLQVLCLNNVNNFSKPINASETLPPNLKKIYLGEFLSSIILS